MDLNLEKQTITIYGKTEKIQSLALKLSAISGEQIYSFFSNKESFIPRMLNIYAMYFVLNEKIKELSAGSFDADYLMKLKYYNTFSETQLFNLFYNIASDTVSFKKYRICLMKLIIINANELKINDGELLYLKNLGKMKIEKFIDYFQYITSISVESINTFDGVDRDLLKDNLLNCSTIEEICDISSKYGIEFEINDDTTKEALVDSLFETLNSYQFVTFDASNIVVLNECMPLEFTLNEEAINSGDLYSRAIIYEGSDIDEFNPVMPEVEEEDEPQGLTVNVVETNLNDDNNLATENEPVEEVEDLEPKEEVNEVEKEDKLEEAMPLELDEVESTSTEKQLGFNDVRVNKLYGDLKILNYVKPKTKLITNIAIATVLVGIAIFILVHMF